MKSLKISITGLAILLGSSVSSFAQLTIDAEFRPRFEYRHGYQHLFPEKADPAAFISQRSRLNLDFTQEKYKFYIGIQDVRLWGDLPQLNRADETGLSLHEIWADLVLTENLNLRLGRQELILDDSRIFGNVDWAQQARSHDLALLQWKKNQWQAKIALAFNQENERLIGTDYQLNNYKTLQLLWLHKDWDKISLSLLAFNNGMQYTDSLISKVRYSQMVGFHLVQKNKSNQFTLNSYYQLGENQIGESLDAYLIGLEFQQKLLDKNTLTIGGELVSGNNEATTNGKVNRAFSPLYATGHKFNGFMDYFYVGNHNSSVGLIDLHLGLKHAFNESTNLLVKAHEFIAPAKYNGEYYRELGTEIDILFSHTISNEISFSVGYSQFFQQSALEQLQNTRNTKNNNFAYVSILVKPTLFTNKSNYK